MPSPAPLPFAIPASSLAPNFAEIQAAMTRLRRLGLPITALLQRADLATLIGGQVWLKAEHRQVTGSFKLRGALNFLRQLTGAQRRAGVVTYSSGNFGIAVAFAGWSLGIPITVVVPADAPPSKLHKIRLMGATIVLADRTSDNRAQLARALAQEKGAVLLPFADQPQVIAGAGTIGLELWQQLQAGSLNHKPDILLVPCGGGGLTAGCAIAMKQLSPQTQVVAVEPEGLDDMKRSLAAGQIIANDPAARSICDALMTRQPHPLTLTILQDHGVSATTVADAAVRDAMTWCADTLQQVVEPGGAIALAALLSNPEQFRGQNVAILLTGANS
jgi:threonine dehydratase